MGMRRFAVVPAVVFALVCVSGEASQSVIPQKFRFRSGDRWGLLDTFRARIPDPQTGKSLTPTTRGKFDYKVEKILSDGAALIRTTGLEFESGPSLRELTPVEVKPKPVQYVLATPHGMVYGPYKKNQRKRLGKIKSIRSWVLAGQDARLWVWHKVPAGRIKVGQAVRRRLGKESWVIHRMKDGKLDGRRCQIYRAHLERVDVEVIETTWFDANRGIVLQKTISETRSKDVSSKLIQKRLPAAGKSL